jgi:NAD+ diphosphatase
LPGCKPEGLPALPFDRKAGPVALSRAASRKEVHMTTPALGYVGACHQRAAEHRGDAGWIAARLADPKSRIIDFHGDRPAIAVDGAQGPAIAWSRGGAVKTPVAGVPAVFLGLDGEARALFARLVSETAEASPGAGAAKLIDLRSLAIQGLVPAGELGLIAQAHTLLAWHQRHRFCANCGAGTDAVDGGYRRHCGHCGRDHFPRTDPVAIMVVKDGERLLLGRQKQFAPGVYSALAGFMEPGETIEDCARREIHEESGIRVGKIAYHASQPWPFPANLMIGLIGEAQTTDIVIDRTELEDVRWFDRAEALAMLADAHPDGLKVPTPMAIAHHLMRAALGLDQFSTR